MNQSLHQTIVFKYAQITIAEKIHAVTQRIAYAITIKTATTTQRYDLDPNNSECDTDHDSEYSMEELSRNMDAAEDLTISSAASSGGSDYTTSRHGYSDDDKTESTVTSSEDTRSSSSGSESTLSVEGTPPPSKRRRSVEDTPPPSKRRRRSV